MTHPIVQADKLKKHTLHLYEEDFRRLQDLYPEIGASVVIRRIVRQYLNSLDDPLDLKRIQIINFPEVETK